jgi:hypothetical protein
MDNTLKDPQLPSGPVNVRTLRVKVDLLVVGDKLDEKPLGNAIHTLEAEMGRELRYAYFTTEEFKYRVGVYDRLVRDVFDYPHRTILDRIGGQ